MKNRVSALIIGTVLSLATCTLSHAMSELISISTTPMWPTSSTPDSNIVYSVSTVGRGGAGLLEVTLTAGAMPPGVTVTFNPPVLRFTGNQVTAQTATMTVHCPSLIPVDCYAFTLTGTSKNETITVTNMVMFTPEYVATRRATLYIDKLSGTNLCVRGLGATGKTYLIEAISDLSNAKAASDSWTPVGYATADGNGRFTFFTSQVTDSNKRFYRAVESTP